MAVITIGMEFQIIIVAVVVALAFAWVVRGVVRAFGSRRRNQCASCDDECCPYRRK
ncbi:MAG: FeoB-associated Cys-rich membrane protein [Alistipes sp.]|nr:FeoB-associated Cys-rich membrane protein [Alistipes sp.]